MMLVFFHYFQIVAGVLLGAVFYLVFELNKHSSVEYCLWLLLSRKLFIKNNLVIHSPIWLKSKLVSDLLLNL